MMALIVSLNLSGCREEKESPIQEKVKESLIVVQASDALDLDPHMYNENVTLSVNGNMFEGLVSLDKNLKIDYRSSLAKSWINPDELTWIFYLRKGVKFHNGTELKASDVKFSLDRAKNHPRSQMSGNVASMESVKVIDDYTVEIKTERPCGILPYKIADVFILSEKYAKEKGDRYLSTHPMGTGPFEFVEWKRGKHTKMVAFDQYWRGKSPVENLLFKSITDDEERLNALLSGKADIILDVPVEEAEKIRSQRNARLVVKNSLRVIYLAFDRKREVTPFVNLDRNPLKDLRVRKAIYYAIDEENIIENIMEGFALPASQFSSPYVFGYNPEVKRLPYDPARARQLLKEAGCEDGFELTLHCTNNRYVKDEEIGQAVVNDLNRIGVRAKLQALPKEEFFPNWIDGEYSFFLVGWACDYGEASSVFEDCIHTPDLSKGYGKYNAGGYSNRELDQLIEQISATINPDKRLSLLQRAQEMGTEDVVWVPLHCQVDLYGISQDVVFEPRLDNRIRAYEIRMK